MRKKLIVMVILAVMLVITACNEDRKKESGLALIQITNPSPMSIAKNTKKELDLIGKIEQDIERFEEIYDVSVIKGKEDILVSYKVKHMQRFRMKEIEKKMNKLLEKEYPDENFIISSDYKIFLEAVELEENMKDPNFSSEDAEKRLQKIIKLKKELT